jgi:hypothetical protein
MIKPALSLALAMAAFISCNAARADDAAPGAGNAAT